MASDDATDTDNCLSNLLPELLDIILLRAYLLPLTNNFNQQKHGTRESDVFSYLVSVNLTWLQRITRSWFKKRILANLSRHYRETRTASAIIRNNEPYLSQNITKLEEMLELLHSSGCLTQEQRNNIRYLGPRQQRNQTLIQTTRSFSAVHYSKLIRCLRHTKQHQMANVAANGGVVVKAVVQTDNPYERSISEVVSGLNEKLESSRQLKEGSKIKELLDKLKNDDIELLNCCLDKNIVAVYLWCKSQKALEKLKEMDESNSILDMMEELFKVLPRRADETMNLLKPIRVDIDSAHFIQEVVEYTSRPIFAEKLEVSGKRHAVSALANVIFVLSRWPKSVRVFDDKVQMSLSSEQSLEGIIIDPWDMGIIYNDILVTDKEEKCIWQYGKGRRWLSKIGDPYTLSASNEGVLLLRKLKSSSKLEIYDQKAKLTNSILLPEYIENPKHAVTTSFGNYFVSHRCKVSETDANRTWSISEVNPSGIVVNQYKPIRWSEELNVPCHLAVTSEDEVIVADCENNRVVLLDSKLQWNRVLLTKEKHGIQRPWRLFYDDEKKRLTVGQLGRKATVFYL